MSLTRFDSNATCAKCVKVTANTNLGYVVFWTDTGSAFEACTRLKGQVDGVTWVDRYHARVEVGA